MKPAFMIVGVVGIVFQLIALAMMVLLGHSEFFDGPLFLIADLLFFGLGAIIERMDAGSENETGKPRISRVAQATINANRQ